LNGRQVCSLIDRVILIGNYKPKQVILIVQIKKRRDIILKFRIESFAGDNQGGFGFEFGPLFVILRQYIMIIAVHLDEEDQLSEDSSQRNIIV
jgi:hypothetical protein